MYSPGSLNLAVAVTLPENVVFEGALNSAFSTVGRSGVNVTEPGPRYLLSETVMGAAGSRFVPGETLASSASHNTNVVGLGNVVLIEVLWPTGPLTKGPASEKPI